MTTPTLDHFETALLAVLREHVAEPEHAEPAAPNPPRLPTEHHRRRLLIIGVAAIAAAVFGAVFLPGIGSAPAYSIQEGNAGQIEVQVNRFEDAAGLESALAKHGINAEITYVPNGGQCAPGRYTAIDRPGISMAVGPDRFQVTLAPGTVRDDETLVIDASLIRTPDSVEPSGIRLTDGFRVIVDANITKDSVPPCRPIPPSR